MGIKINEIKKLIKEKRTIKDSSLNAYIISLNKLAHEEYKTVFDSDQLKKFAKNKKYLAKLNIHTRKNLVAAIVVASKSIDKFTSQTINKYEIYMKELIGNVDKEYSKNKKSVKDKKNWINYKEIIDKIKELMKITKDIPKIKDIKRKELDNFQQLLILSLYTLIPPQRNNYANTIVCTKNKKCEDTTFNYMDLDKKEFIINNYKTKKIYGVKTIKLPSNIINLIKIWMKLNPTDFLLINTTNKTCMKPNGLTKYLNKIFIPKKVSTTILRKLYLTNKYPIINSFEEMLKDADIMGHSVNTQQSIYRKKD
jgi:hypothetical protein